MLVRHALGGATVQSLARRARSTSTAAGPPRLPATTRMTAAAATATAATIAAATATAAMSPDKNPATGAALRSIALRGAPRKNGLGPGLFYSLMMDRRRCAEIGEARHPSEAATATAAGPVPSGAGAASIPSVSGVECCMSGCVNCVLNDVFEQAAAAEERPGADAGPPAANVDPSISAFLALERRLRAKAAADAAGGGS
ncbi:hypothetical protein H696_03307 [Fonticula alba]|uniref:Oxidoreductase-like domain-containing protein n=1 Tax=Fonticula alba TaxID=691883 RepID=A0A058Z6B7_FONAL|nr:hypothetical protein H696_03307 [Fonticula alba]KCV69834.1 hypothetical protein H696_03307 [Fonticula alba]|eukprot:XP_009495440.1 hypothetical protein H696_03307 [Fonticula alba]